MLVAPPPCPSALPPTACGASRSRAVVPSGLLDTLARVPDPYGPRGVRYQLATLLAFGVCAMTTAGHNSLVAIAEWARRCDQEVLARPGCPFDPFTGRYRAPGERTLRDAFAKVDPAALTAAGFARLTALTSPAARPLSPDGVPEREQRRAHRAAVLAPDPVRPRRRAFAVDGKCLRGAVRADGSRMFVLTAVRHDDALTAALREICDPQPAIVFVGGREAYETLQSDPALASRIYIRLEILAMIEDEILKTVPDSHPVWRGVDEALLKRIDTQYALGSFREWVKVTKHVLKGMEYFGADQVDDRIVDWALARC
ncbi:transposase family protein [Streptomyces sp. NPDC015184]|uniref:transposase family protein n=1 Tax=Streptomyces sp. NPDC015184 TaxID=3364946 RepID=UPI0036F9556C